MSPTAHASLLRETLRDLGQTARYADWRPRFRLEEIAASPEQSPAWWILDGEVKVGLVFGPFHSLELVNHFPDAPRAVAFPALYHAPTAPGDRLTLANWIEWAQATTSERHELTFSEGGETLTVRFEEWWADGAHGVKTCTLAVDPDLGYVLRGESRVESPVAHQVEFANFLPERVVDDRPERQRYPFILWQHPSGRVLRWNQNNVGAGCYGNRDHHGLRQVAPHGFLGYFGESDRCPVLEFHGSNHPLSAATCHNMLDEHMHWVVAPDLQPPQDAQGLYTYEVAFTLGALPGAAGERLAAQAEVNDLITDRYPAEMEGRYPWTRNPARPLQPMHPPVFRQGSLCDFTEPVDPGASDRCQCFLYPTDDPQAPVSLLSAGGRRTGPCLRLQSSGEPVSAGPEHGTALHLTEGRPCRVSAWLKTDLRSGRAWLRVWEWIFTPRGLTREYLSASVSGESDWTEVAVEFTPHGPRTHCLSLQVVLEGEGTVWADELLLEQV